MTDKGSGTIMPELDLHDSRIHHIGLIDDDFSVTMLIERISYEGDKAIRETVQLVFENVVEIDISIVSKNTIGSSIENTTVKYDGLSPNGKLDMYIYVIEIDIGKITIKSSGHYYVS